MNGLSLFANVGIGETYLSSIGINIKVANELLKDRVSFYKQMHPDSSIIQGSILEQTVFDEIIKQSLAHKVDVIIATPPCQGMSIAGRMSETDPRNSLIIKAMDAFTLIKPNYMLIENVPQMLKTFIIYNGEKISIPDFIRLRIGEDYEVKFNIFDASSLKTPQYRKRTIVRIYKKGLTWNEPEKNDHITVAQAIGDLPSLEAGQISDIPFHYAKPHNANHITWMKNTKTGQTAFNNVAEYKPMKDGRLIKGFATTYKRIDWTKPSPTVTMANGSISSQNNVHPGRLQPDGTYSDARVLTPLELFRIMGLPDNWNPPTCSDNMLRHVLGEAVPPKMMLEIFKPLIKK